MNESELQVEQEPERPKGRQDNLELFRLLEGLKSENPNADAQKPESKDGIGKGSSKSRRWRN